jgi:hypothetical protein
LIRNDNVGRQLILNAVLFHAFSLYVEIKSNGNINFGSGWIIPVKVKTRIDGRQMLRRSI